MTSERNEAEPTPMHQKLPAIQQVDVERLPLNQSLVFDHIRRSSDGMSRVQLAHSTGLSAQAVSNIVRRLIDDGSVLEGGKTSVGPGKPRTILEINGSRRYALGVHIDPARMTFIALNLLGHVVARSYRDMPPEPDPDRTVAQIARSVRELLSDNSVPVDRVLGIGIASPGPIDSPRGLVVGPPLLAGWKAVPLRETLSGLLDMPALLDNDATAAAVGELWCGNEGSDACFAFIYLGTGIGLGVVLDGQPMRGTSRNAGEIGHWYASDDVGIHECGRRGCIGKAIDPRYLVEQAVDAGLVLKPSAGERTGGPRTPSLYRALARLADEGSPAAQKIIDSAAKSLGRVVQDVANLLDLDRVIVGGPMWEPIRERVLHTLSPPATRQLVVNEIHTVDIVDSNVGTNVGAVGAACLVLDQAYSPHLDQAAVSGPLCRPSDYGLFSLEVGAGESATDQEHA